MTAMRLHRDIIIVTTLYSGLKFFSIPADVTGVERWGRATIECCIVSIARRGKMSIEDGSSLREGLTDWKKLRD